MKPGERKVKRDGIYNTMERNRNKDAEKWFRSPVKAYGKCQTMMELRHIMQVADRIDDEDRRVIHGMAAKY